jgi:hypothetical protein
VVAIRVTGASGAAMLFRAAAVAFASAVVVGAASAFASSPPRNDHLLVLDVRAGPYRYLAAFKPRHVRAYEAARAAFGTPSRFRTSGNVCRVAWAAAGVSVGFASEDRPCAPGHLAEAAWYGMTLFGSGWHNRTGVRIGATVQEVRRAYPHARFDGPRKLDLVMKRQDEFLFVKLAVVLDRGGRVRAIEVPAAYVY